MYLSEPDPHWIEQLLAEAQLVDKDGGSYSAAEKLNGKKYKLLYFSAHWCPPCRGFTPELAKTYAKLKADGKDFELVFVSSDRSEDGFKVSNRIDPCCTPRTPAVHLLRKVIGNKV